MSDPSEPGSIAAAATRTSFVDAAAWVCVAFGALWGLAPVVLVSGLLPRNWTIRDPSFHPMVPIGLLVGSILVPCGIGLLHRRAWARLLFMVQLVVAVLVVPLLLILELQAQAMFRTPWSTMIPVMVVTASTAILYGWTYVRFASGPIAREFGAADAGPEQTPARPTGPQLPPEA